LREEPDHSEGASPDNRRRAGRREQLTLSGNLGVCRVTDGADAHVRRDALHGSVPGLAPRSEPRRDPSASTLLDWPLRSCARVEFREQLRDLSAAGHGQQPVEPSDVRGEQRERPQLGGDGVIAVRQLPRIEPHRIRRSVHRRPGLVGYIPHDSGDALELPDPHRHGGLHADALAFARIHQPADARRVRRLSGPVSRRAFARPRSHAVEFGAGRSDDGKQCGGHLHHRRRER